MAHPADEPSETSTHSTPNNGGLKNEGCHRALWTLSAGNRTLLRAKSESDLWRDMCQVIVEKGGYRHACVAYAGHDEQKSIHWKACVGLEEDVYQVLMATQLSWADTKDGQSAVSVAIRTGKPSVTPLAAIPADVSYAQLREAVLGKGFITVGAFPLLVGDEILGALALSCDAPDAFNEQEIKLLSELAEDLAYGVANLRMRGKHDEAQATIARLAYYDPLTNLPNRALLLERLDAAMQAARQQHRSLALLHLDVGRFHEVNKVLGYHSGDQVVQEVARRLLQAIQQNETLARVGETEFSLLLPTGNAHYATQVAQRLAAILRDPVAVSGLMLDANVSIGIALFPGHATDPDTLLRRAHAALRQNRPTRDGYAIYTGGQEEEYTRRLALMGDLHGAIAQNELLLYCQPKVDIASRRVHGVEALVRWQHPVHGMVLTSEFIKLAEQAGLITPLTNWMMEAAFSQAYAWREAGLEQALSVNLSALDLHDPKLIDRIRGLFSTWGIAPELIQFELTESALMEDPAGALETLGELKGLGTRLFIDDFGTGYSSLSYLQKLPVDSIKIDQSFVAPMIVNNDSAVIVRSTIELGHNLDLEVVAEGVESQAIWDQLAELGCDVAQGYLVSAPMPADRFKAWESEWSQAPGEPSA